MLFVTASAATITAYVNDGLLVSWSLAASGPLPFALGIALTDAPLGNDPTLLTAASTLAVSVGSYVLVVGSTGYLVGVGLHYVLERGGSGAVPNES